MSSKPYIWLDRKKVIDYYKNHTLVECSEKFGCCEETIKRRLLKWGIPLKTKTEAIRQFIRSDSKKALAWRKKKSESQKKKYEEHGESMFSRVVREKIQEFRDGKFRKLGKENGRWKGGISTSYWKQRVIGKYGEKCQVCGWNEVPEVIEVHHGDFNRKNNAIENGIVLCPNCHRIIHFKERGFR